MSWNELKTDSTKVLKEYGRHGLRWSYLINGTVIVIGIIVNFFLPHGWVVWPAVLAIGIMVMINEAADRNASGIPPLHVYGWFFAALAVWATCAFLFSKLAPILLIVAVPAAIIFGGITFVKNKKRNQIIAERRARGLCIHCGEPADFEMGACGSCGKELSREETILTKLRASNRSAEDAARTREVLSSAPPTIAAKRKEQALIAARQKAKIKNRPPMGQ